MNTQIDVRNVLPTIGVPTLVLHRTRDRDVNVEEGRWMASQIPDARYVELDGDEHVPWLGDVESLVGEIEDFLTGARPVAHPDGFWPPSSSRTSSGRPRRQCASGTTAGGA
ncbi:MAG TPA: alpha/beta hydrolase [Gaiellaceae bacterium]|nr:alpha/beta hydrolase [Gaiellaceae bacterium]